MKRYYIFIIFLVAFSSMAVAGQYFTSRGSTSDIQTVNDLSLLQTSVDEYGVKNSRLPTDINQIPVNYPPRGFKDRLVNYTYKPSSSSYELCADFKTDAKSRYSGPGASEFPSAHKKGHQCFTRQSEFFTPPPVSPGLVVCGTRISAISSDIDTISSIDLKNNSLTAKPASATTSVTTGYSWPAGTVPPIYDANCTKLSLSQLKLGDMVAVYVPEGSNTAVAIQKQ